jgi:hypothetical protein
MMMLSSWPVNLASRRRDKPQARRGVATAGQFRPGWSVLSWRSLAKRDVRANAGACGSGKARGNEHLLYNDGFTIFQRAGRE